MSRRHRDWGNNEYGRRSDAATAWPGKRARTDAFAAPDGDAVIARDSDRPPPPSVPAPVVHALDTQQGAPLPDGDVWSDRVGADVAHARVVEGPEAAAAATSIDARAFTVGDRVFFGGGYDAGTDGGSLLEHELVHVAQQDGAEVGDPSSLTFTEPGGSLEREAEGGLASSSGGAAIARDEAPEITAPVYFAAFAPRIGDEVLRFLGEQPLDLATKFLSMPSPVLLGPALVGSGGKPLADKLQAWLAPQSVDVLVDKGRKKGRVSVTDGDKTWVEEKTTEGPGRWFPDVAVELGQALAGKLHESLRRIVPRYIDAAVAVGMEAEQKEQRSLITPPAPTAADIVASQPIDTVVVASLLAQATFDYQGFRVAHPDQHGKRGVLRPLCFCWEPPRKGTFWLRVSTPADPTVEEVANAIFGAPTYASRIAVSAAPLFGFAGASDALPHHQEALTAMGADVAEQGNALAEAQSGPLADEIAKNQAGGETTVIAKGDALRVIDATVVIVTNIEGSAARFGMGKNPAVEAPKAMLDRLERRRTAILAGDDAHARSWGPQLEAQQKVLSGVAFGFGLMVEHLDDLTKKVEDATVKLGGFNLPPYVREAMNRVAMRYADAMLASDAPGNGNAMLERANAEAKALPIDFLEGALAGIQRALDDARKAKRSGADHDYDVAAMQVREESLRRRLATARTTLLSNPQAAADLLEPIVTEITDLSSETEMVANMDQIDGAWDALHEVADSFWTSVLTTIQAKVLMKEGDGYHARWKAAYALWQTKDPEKRKLAKQQVDALRADPALHEYFGKVQGILKQAARDAIIGKLVALLVITVVTAGVGEILAAGALGAGMATAAGTLSTGGAILVGAGEAVVFTALSQALLDDNHEAGHIAFELGANWLMFGALRKFAAFAEAAKLSAVAKGGGQAVLLGAMTLAKAEIDKYMASGKHLTMADVGQIAVQALIMYIAMNAVMKHAAPILKPLEGSAYAFGTKLRANNAAIKALKLRLAALDGKADLATARKYVADERAWLEQRAELLAEIEAAAAAEKAAGKTKGGVLEKSGMTLEQVQSLRTEVGTALTKTKSVDILLSLEQVAPGLFKCPAERFDAVVGDLGTVKVRATGRAGARAYQIETPDGKLITVLEKLDPHVEWFNLLKERLTPEGLHRLEAFFAARSPKELYDEFGGNMEVAIAKLSGSNLPTDLLALRETLTPDARRAFDDKWHSIGKGSRNPSEGQIKSFRSFLESLRAKGDLAAELEAKGKSIDPDKHIPEPIGEQYPKEWEKFDPGGHEAFRLRLEKFRGNENLASKHKGGEGAIFTGMSKNTALKRWFKDRLPDMDPSLEKLAAAEGAVSSNPELAKHVDVVKVHERSGDYILRDYDPGSSAISEAPASEAARQAAIEALQSKSSRSTTEDLILKKLVDRSDNLHWSPSRNKILIIDMQ